MNCQTFLTGLSLGHLAESATRLTFVPSGLLHQHDRVSAWFCGKRDFGEVQSHGFGVADWQDEARPFAVFRADRAEDVGRFRPLIFGAEGRAWPSGA